MQALAKESQKPGAKKSGALHISGASIASACAATVPAFAGSYSVHPCTPTAVKEGRCAERQQYHLRNSTAGDEVTSEPAPAHLACVRYRNGTTVTQSSCLRNGRTATVATGPCVLLAQWSSQLICLLCAQRPSQ